MRLSGTHQLLSARFSEVESSSNCNSKLSISTKIRAISGNELLTLEVGVPYSATDLVSDILEKIPSTFPSGWEHHSFKFVLGSDHLTLHPRSDEIRFYNNDKQHTKTYRNLEVDELGRIKLDNDFFDHCDILVIKRDCPESLHDYLSDFDTEKKLKSLEPSNEYNEVGAELLPLLRLSKEVYSHTVLRNTKSVSNFLTLFEKCKDVIISVVSINGNHIKLFPEIIRNDRDIVHASLSNSGCLEIFSDEIKNDKKMVEAAVRSSGSWAFMYASEELKDNYEFVLMAVRTSGNSLFHASDRLRKDIRIIHEAVTRTPRILEHMSSLERQDIVDRLV